MIAGMPNECATCFVIHQLFLVETFYLPPHISFRCQPLHVIWWCFIHTSPSLPHPFSSHPLALNPASLDHTCSRDRLADRRIRSLSDIHPDRHQGTRRHTELELLPVHTCGSKLIRLWAGSCSSACVLRAESCLGTNGRSTPKTYPLSYMLVSAAHSGLTIGSACLCLNGPDQPRSNIHRRH